jgi:hypothetical protein
VLGARLAGLGLGSRVVPIRWIPVKFCLVTSYKLEIARAQHLWMRMLIGYASGPSPLRAGRRWRLYPMFSLILSFNCTCDWE